MLIRSPLADPVEWSREERDAVAAELDRVIPAAESMQKHARNRDCLKAAAIVAACAGLVLLMLP